MIQESVIQMSKDYVVRPKLKKALLSDKLSYSKVLLIGQAINRSETLILSIAVIYDLYMEVKDKLKEQDKAIFLNVIGIMTKKPATPFVYNAIAKKIDKMAKKYDRYTQWNLNMIANVIMEFDNTIENDSFQDLFHLIVNCFGHYPTMFVFFKSLFVDGKYIIGSSESVI